MVSVEVVEGGGGERVDRIAMPPRRPAPAPRYDCLAAAEPELEPAPSVPVTVDPGNTPNPWAGPARDSKTTPAAAQAAAPAQDDVAEADALILRRRLLPCPCDAGDFDGGFESMVWLLSVSQRLPRIRWVASSASCSLAVV